MSSPYVYRPQAAYQPTYAPDYRAPSPFFPPSHAIPPHSPYASPYHSPYHSPYTNSTPLPGSHSPYGAPVPLASGSHSPYGIPVPLPGGSHHSPYGVPTTLPGGSPHSPYGRLPPHSPYGGSPHSPHSPLPGAPNTPMRPLDGSYLPPWHGYERQRRPSYHGPQPGPSPYDHYLHTPPVGHHRAHSFGDSASPYRPNFDLPYPSPGSHHSHWSPGPGGHYQLPGSPGIQGTCIHEYLNGEIPRGDFIFDISSPSFNPLRKAGPGAAYSITEEEYYQPATVPPITRLRIICDAIPQWPIDIVLNSSFAPPTGFEHQVPPPPPITVGDVLKRIYDELHVRITQAEWAMLNLEDEGEVGRVFTERCKALGNSWMIERNHGVKRVDFLLGKIWFKGLTRVDGNLEVLKLYVEASP